MLRHVPLSSTICAQRLQRGDKQLVGNTGYRRFLAPPREGHFEIDARRVEEDARFDGLYVLRTNSKLPSLSVALAYRQLWKVEAILKTAKAILETRPIYYQSDTTIVGHLFCSFLALLLRKELDERLVAANVTAEGLTSCAISIASSKSSSINKPSASSYDLRPRAAQAACSKPSASPCRRWCDSCRLLPPPPSSRSVVSQRRRGRPRRGATSA